MLAAAIIALAGIALGIFVGQNRALGLEHSPADDVFRRNELEMILLALDLGQDGIGDFGISRRQAVIKKSGDRRRRSIGIQNRHQISNLQFTPEHEQSHILKSKT